MDVSLAHTLAQVIEFLLGIVQLLVFASIITGWVGDRSNPIVQAINTMTEPIYRPVRRLTSRIPGPLDWAPIGVLIVLIVIKGMVVHPLKTYRGAGEGIKFELEQ